MNAPVKISVERRAIPLSFLAKFSSKLWVIILHEYKSIIHKPRSKWDRVMLQCAVIAGLPLLFTWCNSPTLQLAKAPHIHHKRVSSMLYGWCNTGTCSSFTNSSTHIDRKFSNFHSSVKKTLFHCSVHFGPLETFDIVLLPQKWFFGSNSAI